MPHPLSLPDGLTSRPLSMPDASAVADVIIAEELLDLGVAGLDADDVIGDWQRPSFVPEQRTIGVFAGTALVAFAELTRDDFVTAGVHPDHRRRGIGTALARWIQATARDLGLTTIGTHVAEGTPADRLLAKLGYRADWTAWDLDLPSLDALVPAAPPAGTTVRAAVPAEHGACWTVIEDGFLEWGHRTRRTFEDWSARSVDRPGFAPWQLRVAVDDATGDVLAAVKLALRDDGTLSIDELATRADQRGRGLASALITDAVRVSAQHGATRWTIATDTRTGARGIYERVGMQVVTSWTHRTLALA